MRGDPKKRAKGEKKKALEERTKIFVQRRKKYVYKKQPFLRPDQRSFFLHNLWSKSSHWHRFLL